MKDLDSIIEALEAVKERRAWALANLEAIKSFPEEQRIVIGHYSAINPQVPKEVLPDVLSIISKRYEEILKECEEEATKIMQQ